MGAIAEPVSISTPTELSIHTERSVDAQLDYVWRAYTEPRLIAKWWGRGNQLDVESWEMKEGGSWRLVEQGPDGVIGFQGTFREVVPNQRLVRTLECDFMPGQVCVETVTFSDAGYGSTMISTDNEFVTTQERDGMLQSGMEEGMNQRYALLDKVLSSLRTW